MEKPAWWFKVTFWGMVKTWPFWGVVGDLQLGDANVTLNHLVMIFLEYDIELLNYFVRGYVNSQDIYIYTYDTQVFQIGPF